MAMSMTRLLTAPATRPTTLLAVVDEPTSTSTCESGQRFSLETLAAAKSAKTDFSQIGFSRYFPRQVSKGEFTHVISDDI